MAAPTIFHRRSHGAGPAWLPVGNVSIARSPHKRGRQVQRRLQQQEREPETHQAQNLKSVGRKVHAPLRRLQQQHKPRAVPVPAASSSPHQRETRRLIQGQDTELLPAVAADLDEEDEDAADYDLEALVNEFASLKDQILDQEQGRLEHGARSPEPADRAPPQAVVSDRFMRASAPLPARKRASVTLANLNHTVHQGPVAGGAWVFLPSAQVGQLPLTHAPHDTSATAPGMINAAATQVGAGQNGPLSGVEHAPGQCPLTLADFNQSRREVDSHGMRHGAVRHQQHERDGGQHTSQYMKAVADQLSNAFAVSGKIAPAQVRPRPRASRMMVEKRALEAVTATAAGSDNEHDVLQLRAAWQDADRRVCRTADVCRSILASRARTMAEKVAALNDTSHAYIEQHERDMSDELLTEFYGDLFDSISTVQAAYWSDRQVAMENLRELLLTDRSDRLTALRDAMESSKSASMSKMKQDAREEVEKAVAQARQHAAEAHRMDMDRLQSQLAVIAARRLHDIRVECEAAAETSKSEVELEHKRTLEREIAALREQVDSDMDAYKEELREKFRLLDMEKRASLLRHHNKEKECLMEAMQAELHASICAREKALKEDRAQWAAKQKEELSAELDAEFEREAASAAVQFQRELEREVESIRDGHAEMSRQRRGRQLFEFQQQRRQKVDVLKRDMLMEDARNDAEDERKHEATLKHALESVTLEHDRRQKLRKSQIQSEHTVIIGERVRALKVDLEKELERHELELRTEHAKSMDVAREKLSHEQRDKVAALRERELALTEQEIAKVQSEHQHLWQEAKRRIEREFGERRDFILKRLHGELSAVRIQNVDHVRARLLGESDETLRKLASQLGPDLTLTKVMEHLLRRIRFLGREVQVLRRFRPTSSLNGQGSIQ